MGDTFYELQEVMLLRHTEPTGLFGLWGAKPVRAVDGVTLRLGRGDSLGVIGSSGSGKTSLLEAMALRRPIDRGRMLLEGREIQRARGDERRRLQRRLQMIHQDAREGLVMDRPIRKQLLDRLKQAGLPDGETRVAQAMEQVELDAGLGARYAGELSGGEQQRAAIAKALLFRPHFIAADEPVSGVDPHLKRSLLGLLEQIRRTEGTTYVIASQDLAVIRRLTERTAVMHQGRLFEWGPTEQVLGDARHPFSRRFIGIEEGERPDEEDLAGRTPIGCPWAGQCPLVSETCRQEVPALREIESGHAVACHAL
jgi:peptide/nickel transport system ATP-binding protein